MDVRHHGSKRGAAHLLAALLCCAIGSVAPAAIAAAELPAPEAADGLIVTFRGGVGAAQARGAIARSDPAAAAGAREVFPPLARATGRSFMHVAVPAAEAPDLAARLRHDPAVFAVQPNHARHLDALLDDTLFPLQWYLDNAGQDVHGRAGTPGADVDALRAWDKPGGRGAGAVVAVVDTGADYTHHDLAANVWVNPGEIPANGVDDDGNGYADDVHGIDAADADADPADDVGHGTHLAGVMAAAADGRGIVGAAPGAQVMPLRFATSLGGSDAAAVECILYALRMKTERGVNVVAINASWGGAGGEEGDVLWQAIELARQAGIVFVASAGNGGADVDARRDRRQYPAAYDLPNIVTVAATDQDDRLASWSSHGAAAADLAAPGEAVAGPWPGGVEPAIFQDDLEAGDGNWEHGGARDAWAITAEDATSGTRSWSDSPGGDYPNLARSHLAIARDLDLSAHAAGDVRVGFSIRWDCARLPGTNDLWRLELSRDGGATWGTSGAWGTGWEVGWRDYAVAVPASYRTAAFRFRFVFSSDASLGADGVHIDDVRVGPAAGGDGHAFLSGTSMATALVSAAAALAASAFPDEALTERVGRLLAAVDPLPSLAGKVAGGGRLNLAKVVDPATTRAPQIEAVLPAEGVAAGDTVTLRGSGFGAEAGRVLLAPTMQPGFPGAARLRVRFRLVVPGDRGYGSGVGGVRVDDVRVSGPDGALFSDDMEAGDGAWTHGATLRDDWGLTSEDAHSPSVCWSDSPWGVTFRHNESWLELARDLDLPAPGAGPVELSFWAKVDLDVAQRFIAELSMDGGGSWQPLDEPGTERLGWRLYRYAVPRDPAAAEVLSWSDAEVAARIPGTAGRHLRLVRADGVATAPVALTAWRPAPRLPRNRESAAAATLGGRIWLIGGQHAGDVWEPVRDVDVFDAARGWTSGPPLRRPRMAHAAAAAGGRLYAIGGFDGETTAAVEVLDRPGGPWRLVRALPEPLERAAAAGLGGLVYVAGGFSGEDFAYRDTLLVYDPAADRWSERSPMSTPRAGHAAVALGGRLYVFGGRNATGTLETAEAYDPGTDRWSRIADLPVPRAGAGAATNGRSAFLAGGGSTADGDSLVMEYDPEADAWRFERGGLRELPGGRQFPSAAWLPGSGLHLIGGLDEGGWLTLDRVDVLPPDPPPARLAILAPCGGAELASGSDTVVAWRAPRAAARFDVRASLDGGRTWRLVARNVRERSLVWRVPAPRGNRDRCRLRVTARTAAGRLLGSATTREPFAVRVLTVGLPQPYNTNFWPGYEAILSWRTFATAAPVAGVDVSFSSDDGATWTPVASAPGNTGLLPWVVPEASSSSCRIRVELRDADGALLGRADSERFTVGM